MGRLKVLGSLAGVLVAGGLALSPVSDVSAEQLQRIDDCVKSTGSLDVSYDVNALFDATNAERRKVGADPVEFDCELTLEAVEWGRYLQVNKKEDLHDRLHTAGWYEGENLYYQMRGGVKPAGSSTWQFDPLNTQDAINGWLDSPDHRANMLCKNHEKMGIGVVYSTEGEWWAVQRFRVKKGTNPC